MQTPDFSTEYEDILGAVDAVLGALEEKGIITNSASNTAYAQIYHQLELIAKGVEKPNIGQEFWIDDETFSIISDLWQDENGAFCVSDPDGDFFVLDYKDEKKRWAIVTDEGQEENEPDFSGNWMKAVLNGKADQDDTQYAGTHEEEE